MKINKELVNTFSVQSLFKKNQDRDQPKHFHVDLEDVISESEMDLLPKQLPLAFSRAIHRSYVRQDLRKYQKVVDLPSKLGQLMFYDFDMPTAKQLGDLIVEQRLAIASLRKDDAAPKRRQRNSKQKGDMAPNEIKMFGDTVKLSEIVMSMVREIEDVPWLLEDEKFLYTNVFISEVITRYNQVSQFKLPELTLSQNKAITILTFERLKSIKNIALINCRRYREKLNQKGIFGDKFNGNRVLSLFRQELRKRIKPEQITRFVLEEFKVDGYKPLLPSTPLRQDQFQQEMEELRDALNANPGTSQELIIPPISVPKKKVADSSRKNLTLKAQVNKILQEINVKSVIKQPDITDIKEEPDKEEIIPVENLLNKSGETAQEVEIVPVDYDTDDDMFRNEDHELYLMKFCSKQGLNSLIASSTQYSLGRKKRPLSSLERRGLLLKIRKRRGKSQSDSESKLRSISMGDSLALKEEDKQEEYSDRDAESEEWKALGTRNRYLDFIHNERHQNWKFPSYNYNILEETPLRFLKHTEEAQYNQFSQGKDVIRSKKTRVSERVPKGSIMLSAMTTTVVTEFDDDGNQSLLAAMDERSTRYKEVEELYNQIMKNIVEDHCNLIQHNISEFTDTMKTPAMVAPFDPQIPLSTDFQRRTMHFLPPRNQDKAVSSIGRLTRKPVVRTIYDEMRERGQLIGGEAQKPHIQLLPRAGKSTVRTRDYLMRRRKAMRRTPSSKVQGLRFNYGGYIPPLEVPVVHHELTLNGYLQYLRSQQTEFLGPLIQHRQEMLEQEKERQILAQKKKELEEIARKKREIGQIREMDGDEVWMLKQKWKRLEEEQHAPPPLRKKVEFKLGFWNPEVLDEDISDSELDSLEAILREVDEVEGNNQRQKSSKPGSTSSRHLAHRSRSSSRARSIDMKRKLERGKKEKLDTSINSRDHNELHSEKGSGTEEEGEGEVHDDLFDLGTAQSRLENVWYLLKMPTKLRIEMAIKYGSQSQSGKLEKAMDIWEVAADNVRKREKLLGELELFEQDASDPKRYFRKGIQGSSVTRMQEAEVREDILNKLDKIEQTILDAKEVMENELMDTLTFQGNVYMDGIPHDVSQMLFGLQEQRREGKIGPNFETLSTFLARKAAAAAVVTALNTPEKETLIQPPEKESACVHFA